MFEILRVKKFAKELMEGTPNVGVYPDFRKKKIVVSGCDDLDIRIPEGYYWNLLTKNVTTANGRKAGRLYIDFE